MTDRAQFEAMLEALINDDQQAAKEIFHNIVVGKSREIYEELLAEDFGIAGTNKKDSGNPYTEEMEEKDMEEESSEDDGEDKEENPFGGDDAEDDAEDDSDDAEDDSDDAEDDAEADMDDAEDDAETIDQDAGDMEDRVMDLEDALEDLKAEFEQLLAGEEHEEENEPGIHGDGAPMHDLGAEMGGDMGGDDDHEMGGLDELAHIMEYVNKIGAPYESGKNIAGSTEGAHVGAQAGSVTSNMYKKSAIDGHMVNNMGGTSENIAQNHVEVKGDAGTRAGGTKGGLADPSNPKPLIGDTMNRPGGDAGKKAFRDRQNGYGGVDSSGNQKKAQGKEVGAKDSNGRGESNTQSVLRARK